MATIHPTLSRREMVSRSCHLLRLLLAASLCWLVACDRVPKWAKPSGDAGSRAEAKTFEPEAWEHLVEALDGSRLRAHVRSRAVRAITFDPNEPSLLWIAGQGGVARYDTNSGVWRREGRTDGLASHDQADLWIDPEDGEIWAAGLNGLSFRNRETSRWRTLVNGTYQMHRRPFDLVRPDPTDPQAVLFLGQQLYRLHRGTGAWLWLGFDEPALDLVTGPDPRQWIVVSEKNLWRVDAKKGRVHPLFSADDALSVMGAPEDPSYGVRLRSAIRFDVDRVAVSTISDGVFLFSSSDGSITYPALNHDLVGECLAPRLFRVGSRLLMHGGAGCWAELSPDFSELRPLPPLPTERVRAIVADPTDPDQLWLGTDDGLLHIDLRGGEPRWHRPPARSEDGRLVEAPGSHAVDLELVDGKLFVAFLDGPVGVLDLAEESPTWKSVPGLCGMVELVPLRSGSILAYGGWQCMGQSQMFTLNRTTLDYAPTPMPWDALISHPLEFLEHRDALWMIGPGRHEGPTVLVGLSTEEEASLQLDSGSLESGASTLVRDPDDADVLWVTARGHLLRVDLETLTQERVRTGVRRIGALPDGRLWIQTQRLETFDPSSRSVTPFADVSIVGLRAPAGDPLVWAWNDTSLTRLDSHGSGVDLRLQLPPNLKIWDALPTANQLWIATSDGLFEIESER